MGCVQSAPHEQTHNTGSLEITNEILPSVPKQKLENEKKKLLFVHSKLFERYFNREFQVSVCAAKGERRTMEDDHICQFTFPNHDNYTLFGVFDGHNGDKASKYLAEHLHTALNNLENLEDSEKIISTIKQMDKEFIASLPNQSDGSTICFVLLCSDLNAAVNMNTIRGKPKGLITKSMRNITEETKTEEDPLMTNPTDNPTKKKPPAPHISRMKLKKGATKKKGSFGQKTWLEGFDLEFAGRVFWCGDSRAYLVRPNTKDKNKPGFLLLTQDHNCDNASEVDRVTKLGGKIINGRVDGKICVTRSFGDQRMKYDGSVVTSQCEVGTFTAKAGDSLLLCCDGLVEKWSDTKLIRQLVESVNYHTKDAGKAMGMLLDDCIYDGSGDNISAMLIQFKDGTKQMQKNEKYENV